jgi:acyl dehydratase
MMKKELDLPEAIISKNVIKFGAPVKMGDSIRSEQTLVSVSDPKRLKLGLGRFWVISVDYYNQDDEWVGTESYDCFGYRRD